MISGVSANDLVPGKDMSFKQDNKTSVKTYGAKQADALEVMLAAGWK
jgi:iron(III) transport system substrate-binding protein